MDTRNQSGYKGVVKRPKNSLNPYAAFIGGGKGGKNKYLGVFRTAELAAKAYDRAAYDAFGEYARLNFPEDYK